MRISTKLTTVIATVFAVIGVAGVFTIGEMRDLARRSINTEARHLAEAMSTLVSFETEYDTPASRRKSYQELIDFIAQHEKRDLEVVALDLTILADVTKEHIGTKIASGFLTLLTR